jgi:DNA-binding transcriptional regulator YhcF (GntR family)
MKLCKIKREEIKKRIYESTKDLAIEFSVSRVTIIRLFHEVQKENWTKSLEAKKVYGSLEKC